MNFFSSLETTNTRKAFKDKQRTGRWGCIKQGTVRLARMAVSPTGRVQPSGGVPCRSWHLAVGCLLQACTSAAPTKLAIAFGDEESVWDARSWLFALDHTYPSHATVASARPRTN